MNYPYFLDIKCRIDKEQFPINTSILKNYKEKTVYVLIKETGESKNIYFKAHYAIKIMGKEEVGDSNQNETPGRRNKVIKNIFPGKKNKIVKNEKPLYGVISLFFIKSFYILIVNFSMPLKITMPFL